MKVIVVLLLSCARLLAEDDVAVKATSTTNAQSGLTITKQCFTRAGVTNLLCDTHSSNGVVVMQMYRFYYDNKHVADYHYNPGEDKYFVKTFSGGEFYFTSVSNVITDAWIGDKNGSVLDSYTRTNGVLTPDPTFKLRKK